MATSTIWELSAPYIATPSHERIQSKKTQPLLYPEEIRDGLLCMYIVSTLVAWPLTMYRDEKPTAFKDSVRDCGFYEDIAFLGIF